MRNTFISLLFLSCCLSCSGLDQDCRFDFSVEGGPWHINNVVLDGSTLAIDAGNEAGAAEYWPEASADADGLWCADISWAHASYQPSRQVLSVWVDMNGTREKRKLHVSAVSGEKVLHFHVSQAGF